MTKSSAPGKIILFGEHAVVYGRPALAIPVIQVQTEVEIQDSPQPGIWIHAPAVDLHAELNTLPSDHPVAAVIHNFLFIARTLPSPGGRGAGGEGRFPDLEINISSTIPVASGFGSGAAVTVALTRALAFHFGYPMTDEEVNAFTYVIENLHHGTPSGIDNTVITYAKPVYFVMGQQMETFKVGTPFTIVIGDTGIPAPTKESVGDVRKLWEADKPKWEVVFDKVGVIANRAREATERGKMEELGALMNRNHSLLQEMTVSSPELDRLVSVAFDSGALGAKMSGGGRGGNMIALVPSEMAEEISSALEKGGAKNTIITQVS
jgi:mevalonate kinase